MAGWPQLDPNADLVFIDGAWHWNGIPIDDDRLPIPKRYDDVPLMNVVDQDGNPLGRTHLLGMDGVYKSLLAFGAHPPGLRLMSLSPEHWDVTVVVKKKVVDIDDNPNVVRGED